MDDVTPLAYICRYLHLVAMAFGVTGTTIANLIVHCEREPYLSWVRLRPGVWLPPSLLPLLTRLMSGGVVVLALTGVALGYLRSSGELNLKFLTVKLFLVTFVFLNGMHIVLHLEPRLEQSRPVNPDGPEHSAFRHLMARLRTHSKLSFVSWYLIAALSLYVRR